MKKNIKSEKKSSDFTKAGIIGVISIAAVFFLLSSMPAFSDSSNIVPVASSNQNALPPEVPALRLDFGKQLAASSCDGVGSPVVNASQKIKNTVDSGEAGNYWAFDDFTRTIQVWKTNVPDEYCASVKYTGSFRGVAGQVSPGASGVLTGSEAGPIQGGYNATIKGTLLTAPLWNTNGGVGTTDYGCDINANCPGAINWVTQYFNSNYTFTYNWWGWIYRAGGKKTWVNASEGNSGDVL
ncbi:MAG: hypothetical protein COU07_02940 [Candidatus Harrisonbacteria bacterium CG10_big_fil_rev_8_21_14_0_10_40_38]|uniref:Uncharacterized protein n=1 Tax=Candidatus Harrisonbacteria bacterium CG10_big_fil_rev_8_21_14_0_10_40_38 TaxID=1974583 RepID=A0A2H0URW1_9BACT|nr:MAG: hypothetical protein COU07_02940 [Candidatus Harrisonbacteria bacterium CG10_big_fil_rev_8_21_14_0_10_40_38]